MEGLLLCGLLCPPLLTTTTVVVGALATDLLPCDLSGKVAISRMLSVASFVNWPLPETSLKSFYVWHFSAVVRLLLPGSVRWTGHHFRGPRFWPVCGQLCQHFARQESALWQLFLQLPLLHTHPGRHDPRPRDCHVRMPSLYKHAVFVVYVCVCVCDGRCLCCCGTYSSTSPA